MLVLFPLEKCEGASQHTIRICPKICQNSDSSKVVYLMIDGSHPKEKPMNFTKEKFYW